MIRFQATIHKAGKMGDKTGWSYVIVPGELVEEMGRANRKMFRVKGKLDAFPIAGVSIMPMGNGDFMLPINALMRKGTGKGAGAMLDVQLQEDKAPIVLNAELLECLADEPDALSFFQSLTPSHQRYFSKHIDDAKTEQTRSKRIAMTVNALLKKMDYGEMIRAAKKEREL